MEEAPNNYESMDFSQIEADPVAGPVLQEMALKYLKEENKDYFEREFTGELDSEGYLDSKKGGSSNTKPSQNIGGGVAMEKVVEWTKEALRG